MTKQLVLALDIGNTRTAVGLIEPESATCRRRTDIATSDLGKNLGNLVEHLLESQEISASLPCAACSVVQSQHEIVEAALRDKAQSVSWVKYHPLLPLTINYDDPRTLGADRIANCLYARRTHPGRDTVIVDVGTAINLEILSSEGAFLGGAIMPGINLQIRSLAERTSALPLINAQMIKAEYPGTSTAECITIGIVQGTAGAVSRLVALARKRFPQCQVLTTGGAWEVIADEVDFSFVHVPDLTLIGTALFSE